VARVYLDDDCVRFAWYADTVQVTLWKALKKGPLQVVPGPKRIGQVKLKEWLSVATTTPERDLRVVSWLQPNDDITKERRIEREIARRRWVE